MSGENILKRIKKLYKFNKFFFFFDGMYKSDNFLKNSNNSLKV